MHDLKTAICVLLALVPAAGAAAASPSLAGRPLPEALAQLQADGLQIVYSSVVVSPAMVVESEPVGDTPRAILDQILAPHGLVQRCQVRGL